MAKYDTPHKRRVRMAQRKFNGKLLEAADDGRGPTARFEYCDEWCGMVRVEVRRNDHGLWVVETPTGDRYYKGARQAASDAVMLKAGIWGGRGR